MLPITPKKRYSCISNASNYGTPRGDDSDSSLYYSMSEDDIKENSTGGPWTVTTSSPINPKINAAKTPLLRKVLQPNCTPRNKNNKRVSFSQIPKPCPTPEVASKILKTSSNEVKNDSMIADTTFELKDIEESLTHIENEEQNDRPIATENGAELATINESNTTDDLECDLHDTVIENPSPSTVNTTLTADKEVISSMAKATVEKSPIALVEIAPVESNMKADQGKEVKKLIAPKITITAPESVPETSPAPAPAPAPATARAKSPAPAPATATATAKSSAPAPAPSTSRSNEARKTLSNVKTLEEVLRAAQKPAQSKNTTKIGRQQLASDSRKSIVPPKKPTTRATTYKRRSSTYEPRKVNPRASLAVLKNVASQVIKTIPVEKDKVVKVARKTLAGPTAPTVPASSKTAIVKSTVTKSTITKPTAMAAPRTTVPKSRLTMAAKPSENPAPKPPRMSIVSSRPSVSSSVRAQRRETRSFLTTFAVAKATKSTTPSSTTSSAPTFIKPSGLPIRKIIHPSVSSTSNTVKSNGAANTNSKCQYCDKFFVKTHGLKTHQLEKCEKIPASARRQLLQKENENNEANSKQILSRRSHVNPQIDDFSKYSRYFVSLSSNEGTSDMRNDDNVAEINFGLKNLRAELRKRAPSGIQRTPQKSIRCHICKKLFLDAVEYADHSTNHPPLE